MSCRAAPREAERGFFRYGRRYLRRPKPCAGPGPQPLADMEFADRTLFSALRETRPRIGGVEGAGRHAARA
jgi:hypothetical protein